MPVTERDNAAFEAGIKLGALYHQFVGSPISLKTAESLEKAISESIGVQPFVREISVKINRKMIEESLSSFGYTELKGSMLTVDAIIFYKGVEARVGMEYRDGYPLMFIKDIKEE